MQLLLTAQPIRPRAAGFTLLEVLIAVLVLAIGLIGLAGLQLASLRYNHSAYLRTQATNLAYDIADRMRVNRDVALNGNYDSAFSTSNSCNTSPSYTGTVAAQDLAQWKNELACTLPDGDGAVDHYNNVFTITVQWDDSRGQSANLQQFILKTQL